MPCPTNARGDLDRAAGRRGNLHPRLRRAREHRRGAAIRGLHAHEHVGDGGLEAGKLDAASGQAAGRLDHAPLDERIGELLRAGCGDLAHRFRQLQQDGQAHAGKHRRAPHHLVAVARHLPDFEIGRAGVVRERRAGHRKQRHDECEDELHLSSTPATPPGLCRRYATIAAREAYCWRTPDFMSAT